MSRGVMTGPRLRFLAAADRVAFTLGFAVYLTGVGTGRFSVMTGAVFRTGMAGKERAAGVAVARGTLGIWGAGAVAGVLTGIFGRDRAGAAEADGGVDTLRWRRLAARLPDSLGRLGMFSFMRSFRDRCLVSPPHIGIDRTYPLY